MMRGKDFEFAPGPTRKSLLAGAFVCLASIPWATGNVAAQSAQTPGIQAPLAGKSTSACGQTLPSDLIAGKTTARKFSPRNSTGAERSYLVHIPTRYDATRPAPVVLSLHGVGDDGARQAAMSGLTSIADREGFILVSPDGLYRSWRAAPADPDDDVMFLRDLIASVGASTCVDPSRIFATGFSRGGFMSSKVGCAGSGLVAAIATVAGMWGPTSTCPPLPILEFHGTEDVVVPFGGGILLTGAEFPGALAVMREWASNNGCAGDPTEEIVAPGVKKLVHAGCKATSIQYVIDGGGHRWPGAARDVQGLSGVGRFTPDLSASELIWAFFKAHPKR